VSILHKLPDRQRRDGLKYKAKHVLKSAMRRLDLSFAKAKQQALNTAIGREMGFCFEMASNIKQAFFKAITH